MPKRILIVDDAKEIREMVSFILVRYGFNVEEIESGQRLRRLLTLQLPDLIILDITMPGEDGYRIYNNLHNDPATRHIPVIIITGHAEDIYKRISADLGVACHMTKPFHPLDLVKCVKAVVGEPEDN
jgi:CheY-like chemotaxis protein